MSAQGANQRSERPIARGEYRLLDLLSLTGVSPSSFANFRRAGLLPPAVGRGRTAHYTNEHLHRLREIVRIRENNMTYADLRDRFDPEPDDIA